MDDHAGHTHEGHSMFLLEGVDGRQAYNAMPPGPKRFAPPTPTAPPKPQRFIRKAASSLSPAEQQDYLQAIQRVYDSQIYTRFVNIHLNGQHKMHSFEGHPAPARFLAWHRRYLVAFEEALGTGIPYWDYDQGFPRFLDGVLPFGTPPRTFDPTFRLPTLEEVDSVIHVRTDPAEPPGARFQVFSSLLETGQGQRGIPMHNQIHMWVGGIMTRMESPQDPVFWLHHAAVDRIWSLFQERDPDAWPDKLTPEQLVLDPWNETVIDVLDITRLGYRYA